MGAVYLATGALGAIPIAGWIALAAVFVASVTYFYNGYYTYKRVLSAENTNDAGFFDRDPKARQRLNPLSSVQTTENAPGSP